MICKLITQFQSSMVKIIYKVYYIPFRAIILQIKVFCSVNLTKLKIDFGKENYQT